MANRLEGDLALGSISDALESIKGSGFEDPNLDAADGYLREAARSLRASMSGKLGKRSRSDSNEQEVLHDAGG